MSFGTAYATKKHNKKSLPGSAACGPKEDGDMKDADMIARIMHKRKQYSQGGMVANDTGTGQEADKLPNQYDDLVLRDELESSYTGENSGDELGNKAMEENDEDVISKIMSSRKKKDKLPRPA